MQIVIDIDVNVFTRLFDNGTEDYAIVNDDLFSIAKAIRNGTPLPKGHGDLITKEQAIELVEFYQVNPQHFDFVNLIDEIKNENPIISAERSDEE